MTGLSAVWPGPEFERIRALPRRSTADLWDKARLSELAELLSKFLRKEHSREVLLPMQAAALEELFNLRKCECVANVGTGKTLVGFLAQIVLRVERAVWLTLPSLIDKTKRELEVYARDWDVFERFEYVSVDALSRDTNDTILFGLDPQVIVVDESHILKNFRSARSQRVSKFYLAKKPILVPLTGTPGDDSLANTAHIKYWVHGPEKSPLPHTKELDTWCQALDAKVEQRRPPGVLGEDLTSAREWVGKRLEETPGSIYYRVGEGVECSLYLDMFKYENSSHDEKFRVARELFTTPDGRQFSESIELHNLLQRLALGYWELIDPAPPEEWNTLRLAYGSFIRNTIERDPDRWIQPLNVINALRHGQLDSRGLHEAWTEIKPTFKSNKKIEWFDPGPLQQVREWLSTERGLVWTPFPTVGYRLQELTGLPFFHNGGIDKKSVESVEAYAGGTGAILSTGSNSFGRNLQDRWHEMLILGTGAKSDLLNQQIGRLHRRGQKAEFVRATFFVGVRENLEAVYRARNARAKFDRDLNRDKAGKLLQGDWLLPGVSELGEGPRWNK